MKKATSLILALMMCLSLCACAHTHVYGEPEEVVALTCTQDGQQKKTCAECQESVTETLSATGHTFAPATAFAPQTCTACGATEGSALSKVITVGQTVEAEDHRFVVESAKFSGALREKRGNITYTHNSDHSLAIKLKFTNLGTEAFERWGDGRFGDSSLEYQGTYKYEGELWVPVDDIVPLATETVYVVYEVPKSMAEDTTGSVFASFCLDDIVYSIVIQGGDGTEEQVTANAEATDPSGVIVPGATASNNTTFSFVFDKQSFTSKVSEKKGNVTHSYGNGNYYLTFKLNFTNMAPEALDDWDSERLGSASLSMGDKYNYEGRFWIPEDEIVPLATKTLYVLFEIPKEVETSTDTLVAMFTIDDCEFTVNCR